MLRPRWHCFAEMATHGVHGGRVRGVLDEAIVSSSWPHVNESMKPIPVRDITSASSRFRQLLDLQLLSIGRSLRSVIRAHRLRLESAVVLDVGCGEQPFRALFGRQNTTYIGLEIPNSRDHFGMSMTTPDLVVYDGYQLPIQSRSVDVVLLLEVLEHVILREQLLLEVSRVLREGGVVILTVPWSARVHFEPNDFVRFTPAGLDVLFADCGLKITSVAARGPITAVVANKLVIGFIDALIKMRPSLLLYVPLLPVVLLLHAIGFVGIAMNVASRQDPLGYTVTARLDK